MRFGFDGVLALNTAVGGPSATTWTVIDAIGDVSIDDDSDEVDGTRRSSEGRKLTVRSLLSRGATFAIEAATSSAGDSIGARLLRASRQRAGIVDACLFDNAVLSDDGTTVLSGKGIRFAALVKLTANQPLGDRMVDEYELKPGRAPSSWAAAGLTPLITNYSKVALTIPDAPSSFAAVATGSTTASMTWVDGSGTDTVDVQRSSNGGATWTTIATVAAGVQAYSATGLSHGSAYSFRAIAVNEQGSSDPSSSSAITTVLPAPTLLTAEAASDSQIDLSVTDNSVGEEQFSWERSPNGTTGWAIVGTSSPNVATYSDEGLPSRTEYFYRVRAKKGSVYSTYSNTASATTLNAVPVITVPGSQTTNEDTPKAINGISIADADGDDMTVEIEVNHGTFTLAQTTGLTFASGDGTGDALANFSGTLAAINAALSPLTFTPEANWNGFTTLSISADDGHGGTPVENISIVVGAVNDSPVVTVPGSQSGTEDTAKSFTGVSVADVDNNSLTVAITQTHGTVALAQTSGLTFSSGSNGSAAMTFSGTKANINAAISPLTVTPAANYNGSAVTNITATDSASASHSASVTVNFAAVNDPPQITFEGGGDPVDVDVEEGTTFVGEITASDVDGDSPEFSIAGGADAAIFSIDPETGVLSFIDPPDFDTPTDADEDGVYVVTIEADDGHGGTDTQTINVTVLEAGPGEPAPFGVYEFATDGTDESGQGNHLTTDGTADFNPDGRLVIGGGPGRAYCDAPLSLPASEPLRQLTFGGTFKFTGTNTDPGGVDEPGLAAYMLVLGPGVDIVLRLYTGFYVIQTIAGDVSVLAPTDGEDHAVYAVIDSDAETVKLYVDGVLAASDDLAVGDMTISGGPLQIGGPGEDDPQCFTGQIDHVLFEARALSDAEIAAR